MLVGSCYDDQMEKSQLFASPCYLLAMSSNHVGQPSDTHDFRYENFYDAVGKTAKTFKVLLKVTFTPL